MATVKEITTLCKAGKTEEAYTQAKLDLEAKRDDLWTQREMGWALYYCIKNDVENGNFSELIEHIEELKSLDRLNVTDDHLIFDNVLFKLGEFMRNHVVVSDNGSLSKIESIYSCIKNYIFPQSKGYSYILSCVIKYEMWNGMADFLDWWNFDNLTDDDYTPYVNKNGQKMMTLAERAYIAKAKALIKLNDLVRIREFLPQLDSLMNAHPEMMYPGYFYGKLLLALGSDTKDELKVILPFARKKSTEFWVWQLLSDVYSEDYEKQLACLLRATHCRTQEAFLGKVRMKLASLYVMRNRYDCAKYHIDAVVRCYMTHGWRLPQEISGWIHQPWINSSTACSDDPIDYKGITDDILCEGTDEDIAVVVYIDQSAKMATIIYGKEKKCRVKFRIKVRKGDILRISYINDGDGRIRVLNSTKVELPDGLTYARIIKGVVAKKDDAAFAFLRTVSHNYFMQPALVEEFNVKNGSSVKCLAVLDFNKKRNAWDWSCVNVIK